MPNCGATDSHLVCTCVLDHFRCFITPHCVFIGRPRPQSDLLESPERSHFDCVTVHCLGKRHLDEMLQESNLVAADAIEERGCLHEDFGLCCPRTKWICRMLQCTGQIFGQTADLRYSCSRLLICVKCRLKSSNGKSLQPALA